MLEYLDVTHLPSVDEEAERYRYQRLVINRYISATYIDGNYIRRANGEAILGCETCKPLALCLKYFWELDQGGCMSACLLTDDRQEYRLHGNSGRLTRIVEDLDQSAYHIKCDDDRYLPTL